MGSLSVKGRGGERERGRKGEGEKGRRGEGESGGRGEGEKEDARRRTHVSTEAFFDRRSEAKVVAKVEDAGKKQKIEGD